MVTIVFVLFWMLIGYLTGYYSNIPVDPLTLAIVLGLICLLFRAKRAYGISLHLDELIDEQSDRYDDWKHMGDQLDEGGPRYSERNRIANQIDSTNSDMENLKRRKW